MVDFQRKGRDKKKVFVVHDEAPYFFEALGFSLPGLLVTPTLIATDVEPIFKLYSSMTTKKATSTQL